jgi:hypothetical protein
VTLIALKSIAGGLVIFLILLAHSRNESALAAAATTIPIATLAGFIAFASASPAQSEQFARSVILALPVWAAFVIAAWVGMRVGLAWQAAAALALIVWALSALAYVRLTS